MSTRSANTRLSRDERAELIRIVQELGELRDRALDLLLPDDEHDDHDHEADDAGDGGPDGDVCPHPADAIEDLSTMGEDLYRCMRCGAEGDTRLSLLNSHLQLAPVEALEDQ